MKKILFFIFSIFVLNIVYSFNYLYFPSKEILINNTDDYNTTNLTLNPYSPKYYFDYEKTLFTILNHKSSPIYPKIKDIKLDLLEKQTIFYYDLKKLWYEYVFDLIKDRIKLNKYLTGDDEGYIYTDKELENVYLETKKDIKRFTKKLNSYVNDENKENRKRYLDTISPVIKKILKFRKKICNYYAGCYPEIVDEFTVKQLKNNVMLKIYLLDEYKQSKFNSFHLTKEKTIPNTDKIYVFISKDKEDLKNNFLTGDKINFIFTESDLKNIKELTGFLIKDVSNVKFVKGWKVMSSVKISEDEINKFFIEDFKRNYKDNKPKVYLNFNLIFFHNGVAYLKKRKTIYYDFFQWFYNKEQRELEQKKKKEKEENIKLEKKMEIIKEKPKVETEKDRLIGKIMEKNMGKVMDYIINKNFSVAPDYKGKFGVAAYRLDELFDKIDRKFGCTKLCDGHNYNMNFLTDDIYDGTSVVRIDSKKQRKKLDRYFKILFNVIFSIKELNKQINEKIDYEIKNEKNEENLIKNLDKLFFKKAILDYTCFKITKRLKIIGIPNDIVEKYDIYHLHDLCEPKRF